MKTQITQQNTNETSTQPNQQSIIKQRPSFAQKIKPQTQHSNVQQQAHNCFLCIKTQHTL